MLQELLEPFFQVFDLADSAFHGDGEGAHRAFQALEEVHLHHADQELLTVFLAEVLDAVVFVLRLELIQHVLGWLEDGKLIVVDLVVQLVVGEKAAFKVDFGEHGLRFPALGKLADLRRRGFVILLDVLARTGDGEFVQQGEEPGGEPFHQVAGIPFAGAPGPFHEGFLGDGECVLDAVDAEALRKGGITPFGDEVDLVA
ncbi:hypothetical protein D9M69_407780 [compost metagenome]